MRPRSSPATRRYSAGFLVVALLGVAIVLVFAVLAAEKAHQVVREDMRQDALVQGRYLRSVLARAYHRAEIPPERFLDPLVWPRVEPELQMVLADFPYFRGLAVRMPGGRVGCAVGEVGPLEPPGPGGGLVVRPGREGGGAGRLFSLAFGWAPVEGAGPRPVVNAWLELHGRVEESSRLGRLMGFGFVVLGVVIYLLAALAVLMTRNQERLLNREREKGARLEAVGEAAGGIAHEVRNPLNAISLKLQYLERRLAKTGTPPEASDYARIHVELGKIRKVVDQFVQFARPRDLEVEDVDLGELAEEVLGTVRERMDADGLAAGLEREGDLRCAVDRERIREVLAAVITNALDAMTGADERSLAVKLTGTRRSVRVVVRDSGEVVDRDRLGDVFEPYSGVRPDALGLGMSVARTLVRSHGGSIEAAAVQGGGCVVTITLPRRFF